jgi:hypothetical protein
MSADPRPYAADFSYRRREDGTVIISYHAAPVAALRGAAATRFLTKVAAADEPSMQRLMARATGNGAGRSARDR